MIPLTAIIKSKTDKVAEMKAVLEELVKGSRTEAACLQYDLHQAVDEPNIFIFHEIWRSAEELEAHNKTPHILKFIKEAEPLLLEGPGIYITNKIK
ncbi:putative quinol monooxygenase [Flavobacterium rivuli]|nr:putative quinol monooxygenase [Flavobacterium rivuli]